MVTKDNEERNKTMHKQALDEDQFMMQVHSSNNIVQIIDFWEKTKGY